MTIRGPDYDVHVSETYQAAVSLGQDWSPEQIFIIQYPERLSFLRPLWTPNRSGSPGAASDRSISPVPVLSPNSLDSSSSMQSDLTPAELSEAPSSPMETYRSVDQAADILIAAHWRLVQEHVRLQNSTRQIENQLLGLYLRQARILPEYYQLQLRFAELNRSYAQLSQDHRELQARYAELQRTDTNRIAKDL